MFIVVSFLGVQFKSKYFRENEEAFSFCKNFELKILIFTIFLTVKVFMTWNLSS